jgi:hypothetical protein
MKKPERSENLHVKLSPTERGMAEALAARDEKSLSDFVRDLVRREYRQFEQSTEAHAR